MVAAPNGDRPVIRRERRAKRRRMGPRLLIIAVVAVAAAVGVPKLAPGLLANLVGHRVIEPPARGEPARRQVVNSRRMILEADRRGH